MADQTLQFSKKKLNFAFSDFPKEDSNPHDQNQNLRCYHYTIGECNALLKYFFSKKMSIVFARNFKLYIDWLLYYLMETKYNKPNCNRRNNIVKKSFLDFSYTDILSKRFLRKSFRFCKNLLMLSDYLRRITGNEFTKLI